MPALAWALLFSCGMSNYGLIGNAASAALIDRQGSIEWCCLPHLDSPPHFSSAHDPERGGRFRLEPQGEFRSEQTSLGDAPVLRTVFETPTGTACLTDWMPATAREPIVYRRLEGLTGKTNWLLICSPRWGEALENMVAEAAGRGALFRAAGLSEPLRLSSSVPLETDERAASARFSLAAGQAASFNWSYGRHPVDPASTFPGPTLEFWKGHQPLHGGELGATTLAAVPLKLLSGAGWGTGAVADSLFPDGAHSPRASLRASYLLMRALGTLGFTAEADAHFLWLCDLLARDGAEGLQPEYRLDGGHLPESRFEPGVLGSLMLSATEYLRTHAELPIGVPARLWDAVELACQAWRRPDPGMPTPVHPVASKVLCWAALDQARLLAQRLGHSPSPRWEKERNVLHHLICEQGYSSERGSFSAMLGGPATTDASLLVIPLLGFLPPTDPRVQGTLEAIAANADALTPEAQLQLASAWALAGNKNAARARFQQVLQNSSALYSASALSALVNASADLAVAETRAYAA